MSAEKEFKKQECKKLSKSFWKIKNIVISIGLLIIPLIFIIGACINFLTTDVSIDKANFFGFNIANGIALFASMIAIISMLYSNHQNENRNEKSICEANNRLLDQLNNQKENLNKQLKANEKNLKNQLIHENKTKVLLRIYDTLFTHQKANLPLKNNLFVNNIQNLIMEIADDSENIRKESIEIFTNKLNIYIFFKEIRNDIHSYYYIPPNTQKIIESYIIFIEEKTCKELKVSKEHCITILSEFLEKIKNSSEFNEKELIIIAAIANTFCDESGEVNKYLNELYDEIESEVGVKMSI